MRQKPDIFFLNETHVTDYCDTSDLRLKNYVFINCASHSRHTGGVCVFISKRLKFDNVTVINKDVVWFLSFEICINNVPTIFACVYLSSRTENKKLTLDLFEQWLESLASDKNIVICGDFK